MTTTRDMISDWFNRGVDNNQNYMIIMCDTFDWEDYPIFCETKKELQDNINNPGNMQKVMETYDLNENKSDQLDMKRAFVDVE